MDAQEFDQRKAQANLSLARSCDPADEMRLNSTRDAALAARDLAAQIIGDALDRM